MAVACWIAVVAILVLAPGCGGDHDANDGLLGIAPPESIVVIGDSIASGEGINYGYTYSASFPNGWTGGLGDPMWEGDYQLCHDSAMAYGNLVAASLGAKLAKFACTGSTYDNGILFDRRYNGQLYRPAQFGDWTSKTKLNAAYDAAEPDLVILTFGADDVSFVDIVTFCATGFTLADAAEVELIAGLDEPRQRVRENFVRKFPTAEALLNAPDRISSDYCVAGSPGAAIENLFWDRINSGEIAAHYVNLVAAIQARGQQAGKVPKIVFTTYPNPLPGPNDSDECLDVGDLSRDELNYLTSLIATLQDTLIGAVRDLPGVSVVDISSSMDGHRYCTDDPWMYGLSVLLLNTHSQAPFHPTPEGQAQIAQLIEAAISSNP